MKNILAISDLHIPSEIKGALSFVKRVRDKYKCETIVNIGDIVDSHAISFHDSDPDGYSSGSELDITIKKLKRWSKAFPKMKICIGNHDAIYLRKAMKHGLSKAYFKTFNDLYETPDTWDWKFKHDIQGIRFMHGTGKSGVNAHIAWAKANRQSTVIGHIHAFAGVNYSACSKDLIFGMNVGCLVDAKTYAMAYAKDYSNKPFIGCGVIIDGIPKIIPMKL